MDASGRQVWIRAAILVGVVYLLIGRLFAAPASHQRLWRLAAWVVSGVLYAAHIGYEHFKLRQSTRDTALHVALAVAIGAFLLAVAGGLHSLATTSSVRPLWFLALGLWPIATAVPAFFVALVAAA